MGTLGSVRTLARDALDIGLARVGFAHSDDRLTADAEAYWRQPGSDTWRGNSHWRGGITDQQWLEVGRSHLAMYRKLARGAGLTERPARILEWGCGGGANAVAFGPDAEEYIGVDIVKDSLDECERQVKSVCDTPFTPVLIDAAHPEEALEIGAVDLVLSTYVLELVPSPEYGLELMRIARDLVKPGGAAFVQIKYSTSWRTRPRRRRYRESVAANMTTYRMDEFWQAMQESGWVPESMIPVPKNDLDERYAYFFLRRP